MRAQYVLVAAATAVTATASAEPALKAPTLVELVEPTYPAEARSAGLEADVVLQLTVDTDGSVIDAKVVNGAGHGFDEAALDNARALKFAPATADGKAVRARVRYTCAFRLPTALAPQAPLTPPPSTPPLPPPSSPTPAPPQPAGPSPAAAELTVVGDAAPAPMKSAEAVVVVKLAQPKKESADLGEVMARTQGVSVRRAGGLGSGMRFSLNGLYDDQIRFFLDGVPLDVAGFAFGIANVPLNLVDRVEVYRGVVPLRFGADALGGAVNLVTPTSYRRRLTASYQVGSFGTYRFAADVRDRHAGSGLVVGASFFVDRARNDYPIEVEAADSRGRLVPATIVRSHDAYRAHGATLETGFVERPWARKLLLRGFASTYDKELQHNVVMTVPYGEATYGESVRGLSLRYEQLLGRGVEVDAVVSGSRRTTDFLDRSEWVYDWFGARVRPRRVPGEVDGTARDRTVSQDALLARITLGWTVARNQVLRFATAPTLTSRSGDERIERPGERDPLNARRELFTLVSGAEYQSNLLGDRIENVAFVKSYAMRARSEEILPGGVVQPLSTNAFDFGAGDALRVRVTSFLAAKVSYEYARRLPRPDELFGNGILIEPNLTLEPEVSHNANLGPRLEWKKSAIGDLTLDLNAFLRESDRLIVLLGNDKYFSYQNVYRARARGFEGAAAWTSPKRHATLDGTFTYQDVRNVSNEGSFADFAGDRIPNRPWMFGSWGARLRAFDWMTKGDVVEPFYIGRYVHEFFRGWESQGLRQYKQSVPSQTTHTVGVSYTVRTDVTRLTSTFEVQNVTDARVYDFFGVQRPGRAVFFKVVGEL